MQIYNTMTHKKEEFIPLEDGRVRMYACGPTVYNFFHIGNARPFIVFDTLRRYLEYRGFDVTYVQNFTDIDDKMINRANEEGITVAELADRFIKEYYTDADALGVGRPTYNPRATEHIGDIIEMIERLIKNGHAYEAGGDVYFSVSSFPEYGKLSGQPLQNLEAGMRVDPGELKRDPLDFALWKAQKPGEPAWESPWGLGRPGWHIECSAMSTKLLGETFDIHGGGQDLIFPHHENEVAQSEGATGKPFVRYWMHNGYINIDNQKMSKSLGNFFTVRDIAKEYDLKAVRLFMLSAHYRSPVNFARELIEQAKQALTRLQNAHALMLDIAQNGADRAPSDEEQDYIASLAQYRQAFIDAMDDDLNTADALGAVFEMVRAANTFLTYETSREAAGASLAMLRELCSVLGIETGREESENEQVLELVKQRQQARASKDWAKADAIRDQLKELGFVVEDTPHGPKIKRVK
ncbi:MAG: cysteine--tRNA ligase [Bacillota bacterium]